ncbi:MAG: cell wall-binding repeat-containing protein [Solirubrobacteraceae bacterium]|nr:cell wall-binding repeat-containing protein [Solirubrobacteraceae bacterium]
MFPSTARDLRPDAVALAGADDWRAILLAAPFAAKPLGFPVLLADGRNLPPVTTSAMRQLQPAGSRRMNSAQVLRIGTAARPEGMRARYVTATTPAGLAKAADRQLTKLRGRASSRILVVNSEDPASAAPAAAWAARSGDPILFTGAGTLPADTKEAIAEHDNPRIYVLGSSDVVSSFVIRSLKDIPGTSVYRIQPPNNDGGPADLAIEFARYSDREFGWNYRDPGHSFVFAPTKDPTSAMAAAALSSGGTYPALLYVDEPDHVSPALRSYLLDIQPGFDDQVSVTQTFQNRGWIVGPTTAIEVSTQARIDNLMEIVRSDNPNAIGDAADTLTAPEATP